jgi:uncharacterized repeat protein (TIGR03803 family)
MKKLLFLTISIFLITAQIAVGQYTNLHDFEVSNGKFPYGSLISDGTFLYGMTSQGGTNDIGAIFKIMPDGTGYVKLLDFEGISNGSLPYGSLFSDGTFLYGMTYDGGINNHGTIFKIMPDGTGYMKLLDLDGISNGSHPYGSLISDGTFLYGMTYDGGISNFGTIFKIMPDGTGFEKLLDFEGVSNGQYPQGDLIFDGTFLYGMTAVGGANYSGTIFKIMTDGTEYEILLDFDGTSNGHYPTGSLISDGTFLYGMTHSGGANNLGTVFKIMPDGTGYMKLLDFEGTSNGNYPGGSLILHGEFLYGMTTSGGTYNLGTIFKIMPDGTGYEKLVDFDATTSGAGPQGDLISDATFLYGMTRDGGTNGVGSVFKFQDITSGINEMIISNKPNVYPNPASNYVIIESESLINNIIITDAIGKVVYQQNLNSTKVEINTSALRNGIYHVKTSGNQQSGNSRVIINR